MRRYISKNEDDYYTDMLKVINAIGGRSLNYNWLITEIETSTGDYFNDEYIILSNDELLDTLEKKKNSMDLGHFFCNSPKLSGSRNFKVQVTRSR